MFMVRKRSWGHKKFWDRINFKSEKICDQEKILGQKNFASERNFGLKFFWAQTNFGWKIFGSKNLESKKFRFRKILCPKSFGSRPLLNFGPSWTKRCYDKTSLSNIFAGAACRAGPDSMLILCLSVGLWLVENWHALIGRLAFQQRYVRPWGSTSITTALHTFLGKY